MASTIKDLLADIKQDAALQLVQTKLSSGEHAESILLELREGMELVGARFETREYYLSDLIMAGAIFKGAMELLEPHLPRSDDGAGLGKVVVGTAKGDIHDIGKNIVAVMLKGAGFEVIDLGVDVPPEKFVSAIRESGAKAVGISALLTTTFDNMKRTVASFEREGLRDGLSVAIGGATVNEEVRKYVGADVVGKDAQSAVEIFKKALIHG